MKCAMEKHKIFCKFLLRENNVTEVPHFSSIEKERERERENQIHSWLGRYLLYSHFSLLVSTLKTVLQINSFINI